MRAGVHEILAQDYRPAVGRPLEVLKVEVPVTVDEDVLADRLRLQQAVEDLHLLAGVDALRLDEHAAGFEAVERAVRHKRSAVVLYQPRPFHALACQDLAGGGGLAVGAQGDEQRAHRLVAAVGRLQVIFAAAGVQENAAPPRLGHPVLRGEHALLELSDVVAVADYFYHAPVVQESQPDGDVFLG